MIIVDFPADAVMNGSNNSHSVSSKCFVCEKIKRACIEAPVVDFNNVLILRLGAVVKLFCVLLFILCNKINNVIDRVMGAYIEAPAVEIIVMS